jgi:peroxiredoxin
MTIQQGEKIPAVSVKTITAEGIEEVSMDAFCAGRKVVIFGVPGAFTPTCSDTHLPGFQVATDDLKAKGVDAVACLATNDIFVMGAWSKARNVGEGITMLADGNGDFIRATGLELDLAHVGLGTRSKRFAAVIDDGTVTYLGIEPGGEVGVSSAAAVLEHL